MPDHLREYHQRGWTGFGYDPVMQAWARACMPLARCLMHNPDHDHWWRCARTWFAGVNILPNAADGSVMASAVPALAGEAVSFIRQSLGYTDVSFDAAQISVVTHGYPKQGEEETDAAYRYRLNRFAAHVDGLERIMPGRRRRLSETHGFLLGIPLADATAEQGAFVVWEGSHEVMRAAFRECFSGIPPQNWRDQDITEVYTQARSRVFDSCDFVRIAPGLGHSYVMHPLTVHGVAPWQGPEAAPRAVAYFRPDTFEGDPQKWLDS